MRGASSQGPGRDRRHRNGDCHRGCAHRLAYATHWLEHGVHQHSKSSGPGNGEPRRAYWSAHSVGSRHDSDSAHRESPLRLRAHLCAAAMLLQCHHPLFVCRTATDLSYRASCLSLVRKSEYIRLHLGNAGLCFSPPRAFQLDELAHPGTLSLLLLERDLRGGSRALRPLSYVAGSHQSAPGPVQRHQ